MNILLKNSKILAYEQALKEEFEKLKDIDTRYGMVNYFIDIVKKIYYMIIYQNKILQL